MRLLYTLLLSLCCFAVTLPGHATDIPAKKEKAVNEYRSSGQTVPNDALNDYCHIMPAVASTNHSCQKEASCYFARNTEKNITPYILNDCFKNTHTIFSGSYAKSFRIKLIFPQHFHW